MRKWNGGSRMEDIVTRRDAGFYLSGVFIGLLVGACTGLLWGVVFAWLG
jgi:hypothetical protein